MIIKRKSPITGITREMDLPITHTQYAMWLKGTLIQDAAPDLTPDEREYIISGVYGDEWVQHFDIGEE
jgi:hypothetical protein